jgi:hypothetical protein
VLTDLDSAYPCPHALIDDWLPVSQHANLLLRVAVREVEAWVLADRSGIARFLGVREAHVPREVDRIADPKAALIGLARKSRRAEVRRRVVPKPGSTMQIGPEYNECLGEFVRRDWNVKAACEESASLHRSARRLRTFTPRWS